MPPTIGPHFSAGDVSPALEELTHEDGEGEAVTVLFDAGVTAGDVVEDEVVEVGSAGKDRESDVEPVGVAVAYSVADWDASAVYQRECTTIAPTRTRRPACAFPWSPCVSGNGLDVLDKPQSIRGIRVCTRVAPLLFR